MSGSTSPPKPTSVSYSYSSPRSLESNSRSSTDSAHPMSTGYSQLLQRDQDDKFRSAGHENGINSVLLSSTVFNPINNDSLERNSNSTTTIDNTKTAAVDTPINTTDNTTTNNNTEFASNGLVKPNSSSPSGGGDSDETSSPTSSLCVHEYRHENEHYHDNHSLSYHDDDSQHDNDDTSENTRLLRSHSVVSFRAINGTVDRLVRDLRCKFNKYTHWRAPAGLPKPNEIYYSVFKPPLHQPSTFNLTIEDLQLGRDGYTVAEQITTHDQFGAIVEDAVDAIKQLHIQPKLISQGSSGSYFVYNSSHQVVGVFKPKDEEPYGPLSPKWTKWIHRNLFPCFFGRSCLIPNNGYIAEAAASLLDRQLGTNIVPFTDIVYLSSPSFYYRFFERRNFRLKGKPLSNKVGSFQLFLHDYVQADQFLRDHPFTNPSSSYSRPLLRTFSSITVPPPTPKRDQDECPNFEWTPQVIAQFREEIEKLVILDYIMRNTDRGLDNWMIKLEWYKVEDHSIPSSPSAFDSSESTSTSNTLNNTSTPKKTKMVPYLRVGAIDSGLAFPWKHPDEWRSYPFGWLFLPMILIGQPFSARTRDHFLPLLSSSEWWEESALLFRQLFSQDTEFSERMFKRQWAVIKGQAFNVVETLKDPEQGPLELVRRTRVMVWDDEMDVPIKVPYDNMSLAMDTPLWTHTNNNSSSFAYPEMPVPSVERLHKKLGQYVPPAKTTALQTKKVPSETTTDGIVNAVKDNDFGKQKEDQRLTVNTNIGNEQNGSVPAVTSNPEKIKNRKRGSSLTLEAKYRKLEQNSEALKKLPGPESFKKNDTNSHMNNDDNNSSNKNDGEQHGLEASNSQVHHHSHKRHDRPQFEDLISESPVPGPGRSERHDIFEGSGTADGASVKNKKHINEQLERYRDDPDNDGLDENDINDVGFSVAEDLSQATKKVIVERLQTVTSKPPVFAWC